MTNFDVKTKLNTRITPNTDLNVVSGLVNVSNVNDKNVVFEYVTDVEHIEGEEVAVMVGVSDFRLGELASSGEVRMQTRLEAVSVQGSGRKTIVGEVYIENNGGPKALQLLVQLTFVSQR